MKNIERWKISEGKKGKQRSNEWRTISFCTCETTYTEEIKEHNEKV